MKPVDDALVNAAYTLFSLHTKLYADVRSEFLPGDDGRTAAQISDSSDGLVQLGTHRSLWETLGNPYALMQAGGRMPRAWMGSNLVKGDEFRDLASRVGVMILPRGAADRTAVRRVYDDTLEGMVRGQTIQIYPQLDGGGRSKTGRPRPWSPVTVGAAINAAKQTPVYASSMTVDYEQGPNELWHLAHGEGGYTAKAKHVGEWLRDQGTIWVTHGAPVRVEPDMDRRELTDYLRRDAYRNTKITAKSAASAALLRAADDQGVIRPTRLRRCADEVYDRLFKHSSRLTFDFPDDPIDLYELGGVRPGFDLAQAQILAGYIDHYLQPEQYLDLMR